MANPGIGLALDQESGSEDEDDESFDIHHAEGQELDLNDFLMERDGRLFHSHGISRYPLPVDVKEQQVRAFVHWDYNTARNGHSRHPNAEADCPAPYHSSDDRRQLRWTSAASISSISGTPEACT
jgi:hypothetical protein